MEYLITESTYGNAKHGPMAEVGPQFLDAVKYCIGHKSRLLLPSFAVGRTQTVLWYIQRYIQEKQIPEIPIFIDSPMGVEVSKIHSQLPRVLRSAHTGCDRHDRFLRPVTRDIRVINAGQQANQFAARPCVIIASSPTCEFGRILHHLTMSVENPNDLVVFIGYIPSHTLGRQLQSGQKRARILDRWYDVKCQIRTIHGLSAHADGDELLQFLKPTTGKQTSSWIVHGEVAQSEGFAHRLMAAGIGRAAVPAIETSVIDDPGSAEGRSSATAEVGE